MSRLAVPLNLHIPPEHTKNLAFRAQAINDYVTGVSVTCSVCKQRGRANSRLVGKGKNRKVLCTDCQRAS